MAVVTASQTNRQGTKKDADEENIAEDIRKLGHVAKMIAINQNKEDHQKQLMRLNMLKDRDRRRQTKQVVVLQNLDIGSVYIDSKFYSDVDLME